MLYINKRSAVLLYQNVLSKQMCLGVICKDDQFQPSFAPSVMLIAFNKHSYLHSLDLKKVEENLTGEVSPYRNWT